MSLAIDLRNALKYNDSNFTCQLFRLINRSDPYNKEKLRSGFPVEVAMVEIWLEWPNEEKWDDIESEAIKRTTDTFGS